MPAPRPTSLIFTNPPPTLQDILSNTAPTPYTLSAFVAFLCQNHCLETLEFTMDAGRYRTAYTEISEQNHTHWIRGGSEPMCSLWRNLMQAYILPCGPREVNLPAHVRDRLLSFTASPMPPPPSGLDEAVKIAHELMDDSLLVPFLQSQAISYPELQDNKSPPSSCLGRSRQRSLRDVTSYKRFSRSAKTGFLPLLNIGRSAEQTSRSHASSEALEDRETNLSGDIINIGTPPRNEPMAPPTTLPISDWVFAASLSRLRHIISEHANGWKKMGTKLGISRKARSKPPTASASSGVADLGYLDE